MADFTVTGVDDQHAWVDEGSGSPPRYVTFIPGDDGTTVIKTDLGGQERRIPPAAAPEGTAALLVADADGLHTLVRDLGTAHPQVLEAAQAFAQRVAGYLDRQDD
jgi:hypothetical protein